MQKAIDIDKELASQLQDPSKKRSTFERIVTLYGEKLYWQIRKMVLNHEDADDLLQNTFLKAWSNLDYFRGSQNIHLALQDCDQRMYHFFKQTAKLK